MRGVIERMARAGHPPLHLLTPEQARAAYEAGAGVLELPAHKLARVENLHIPARDGHLLPARLYAPAHERLPVLLYFHGGGFTIGSVATHDTLCRHLSHLAHCAVVSLDYRLAPDARFPTAFDDAWDALAWLARHGAALALDTDRLAVGGDSAGGTLAAASAIAARDAGLPLRHQLLFYPGCAAFRTAHRTTLLPRGSCWKPRTSTIFLTMSCATPPTGRTGALRRFWPPMWRAWRRPGSDWPNATRWWTRALPTPTSCVPPGCRSIWKSTAA